MKRLLFLSVAAVVAMSAVSCDNSVEIIETRDPDDVTGTYEVDYKLWIDGVEVAGEHKGSVEGSGKPIHELSMKFRPDEPVLTIPAWNYDKSCEYIPLWPIRPVGQAGTYTFDDYRSGVSLEWAERSHTGGELTMSGKITHKSQQELVDDGFAYWWESSCLYKADLPDSPGVYYHMTMTIDFEVPDPTLPSGTQIFPEQGIGVHKFHIEITSR